jgi:hypothetical protein
MLDPYYKKILGFNPDDDDKTVLEKWRQNIRIACKPCWELKYCPYGPLVEDFPPYPVTRDEIEGEVADIEILEEFPKEMPPKIILECYCTIFGHMCPVFFVRESFTESEESRRITRHIPPYIMLKVARRDNYTCQVCGKHLTDDTFEFDHLIPISKGGPSDVHNLRMVCRHCNRKKSNKIKT